MKTFVHPSYAQLVVQLTSDEVKLLNFLIKKGQFICESTSCVDTWGQLDRSVADQFKDFCIWGELDLPELSATYYENLVRLRIIREDNLTHQDLDCLSDSSGEKLVSKEIVSFTDYGINFMKVCQNNT